MIGEQKNDIASSEYLHKIKGIEFSPAPYFDIDEEYTMQKFVASVIKDKLVKSAHDISEGGLMICLFEKAFNKNLGFDVSTVSSAGGDIGKAAYWFGEAQGRILVTCSRQQAESLKHKAAANNIPLAVLGTVTSGSIKVNTESWGNIFEWKEKYDTAIENILN